MTKYHDKLKFQLLVEGNVKPVEVIIEQEEKPQEEDLSRKEKEGNDNDNDNNAKENNRLGKT